MKGRKRKKRTAALLLGAALVITAACALLPGRAQRNTPRIGVAVAAPQDARKGGTAPVFEGPDEAGRVILRLYSGAPLTVLDTSLGGLVRVQSGQQGTSLLGYMRAEDLRYGAQAMRETPLCCMLLQFPEEGDVFAYCDEQAGVVDTIDPLMSYMARGFTDDGFAQLIDPSGAQAGAHGFVRLKDVDVQEMFLDNVYSYTVEPLEGEMTREEALEKAVEYLLDGKSDTYGFLGRLPEEFRSREGLLQMDLDLRLVYSTEQERAVWWVMFTDPENYENNISVDMMPQGELIEISRGNG